MADGEPLPPDPLDPYRTLVTEIVAGIDGAGDSFQHASMFVANFVVSIQTGNPVMVAARELASASAYFAQAATLLSATGPKIGMVLSFLLEHLSAYDFESWGRDLNANSTSEAKALAETVLQSLDRLVGAATVEGG
jgi:hypothetical protein